MSARQSSRLLNLVLLAALCALLTHWVLMLSSLRSLGASRGAHVAQIDVPETGAVVTPFGGGPQNSPCNMRTMGMMADLADGSGAAIVSMDSSTPQTVRVGKSLSSNIELMEVKTRSVVIKRNGARQEIPLPTGTMVGVSPVNHNTSATPLPPVGVAAPLSTPATSPVPSVANNPASTAMPGAMLSIAPTQVNTGDEPVSQGDGTVGLRHRTAAVARKGDIPQPGADQQACYA